MVLFLIDTAVPSLLNALMPYIASDVSVPVTPFEIVIDPVPLIEPIVLPSVAGVPPILTIPD